MCYMRIIAALIALASLVGRNPLARDPLGQRSRSGFDPLCRGLRTVSHLRTLLLRDVGIDDGEVEGVASFLALSVRLEKLDLSENQVTAVASSEIVGRRLLWKRGAWCLEPLLQTTD